MRTSLKLRDVVDAGTRSGLELEYEGVSNHTASELLHAKYPRPLWKAKRDGSLRPRDRNTELIFDKGLSGKVMLEALTQLSVLKELKFKMSWRCSMHVHTDYSGLFSDVPYRALMVSSILEPALFAWAGPSRVESKFCAPTRHSAEYILRRGQFRPQKYTAFNLAPLKILGTTELRVADSTRDTRHMLDYINVGLDLRRIGQEFDSGWHLLESVVAQESAAAWIEHNMHPLVSAVLAPHAAAAIDNVRWIEGFATAARMADREKDIERFVV